MTGKRSVVIKNVVEYISFSPFDDALGYGVLYGNQPNY